MNEPSRVLSGHRVLIVEDEALIAIALEDEVRMLGCGDTYIAYQRSQALRAIDEFGPTLAIIDVSLTDDGEDYEIADTLADRGIRFIFSSGHLAGELPDRHVSRPFLSKPMVAQDFIDAVTMALT